MTSIGFLLLVNWNFAPTQGLNRTEVLRKVNSCYWRIFFIKGKPSVNLPWRNLWSVSHLCRGSSRASCNCCSDWKSTSRSNAVANLYQLKKNKVKISLAIITLGQWRHLKGFSPVWVRSWSCHVVSRANRFLKNVRVLVSVILTSNQEIM